MKDIKKRRINIEGEKIIGVGYRPFLLAKALRLRIPNFDAENVEENGIKKLIVSIMGEEEQISEFEKFVKDNFPENAKVDNITIEEGISDMMQIEEYRKLLNSEQLNNIIQGGLQLRDDTNKNFKHMDEKYELISKGMFATVDEIKETNKIFERNIEKIVTSNEERNKAFERRMEKTEKNIEELLKILAEKKS